MKPSVPNPSASSDPLLLIDDRTVSFAAGKGWNTVVHGVSLDVGPGETVALVGESGSGKSVTAMSILGLLSARQARTTGRVVFKDRDLSLLNADEMRALRGSDIAMIFQEPMTSLNPVMTCGAQIAESLTIHRGLNRSEAHTETLQLFDRVRISDAARRFDEYPHSLSGGMRQRIMIAMALACKPSLLIADEPTTALDVTIQAQILALIKELQDEEGMAVLFITHDMGVVAEISDRTVVMNKGRVVEAGPTAAIFSDPAQGYTRSLLSAVPRLGSMKDRALPERFPVFDRETGVVQASADMPDTVVREKPLLEVEGLTTRFTLRQGFLGRVSGRVHAVENVAFTVRAGETLSLVGESGCGKSTTGRSILRLTEPDAGSVVLDGTDITALDSKGLRSHRRHMQMIFQDPYSSLNPRRSVGDSILEPLLVNRLADRSDAQGMVRELLQQVGLDPESRDRYPHEFSGGQRQRICIARALAVEPKLIVADESVSALDVSVKAQVINLMLDLQARMGVAYLFISHDMAVVERVSHRVAVMYLGEIVEIGSRQAVFGNPQHPYTKRLLSAVPVADPSRRRIKRILDSREIQSPIRDPGYRPPQRRFIDAGPDHRYMEWNDSWA
ncbi:peptide/nickel transport system ATP-binding protein [Hoeflea marina]|uniref:Glutathione import ATP-binding protein GsiA n=1 Tax=Hoeflea marina TaxID=274592 RepID=A0A317PF96_9HYPH|nr:ABC transporter ATP-binding protein [Hoeflea marina]PWV97806.1 peptide/nickel transport system ATP-binding protein [Hoeflea marina]